MSTCKYCIHQKPCIDWAKVRKGNKRRVEDIVRLISVGEHYGCEYFKNRSKFIEQQTGEWIRHKPDAETMRAFHMVR